MMKIKLIAIAFSLLCISCKEDSRCIINVPSKLVNVEFLLKNSLDSLSLEQTELDYTIVVHNPKYSYLKLDEDLWLYLIPGENISISENNEAPYFTGGISAQYSQILLELNKEKSEIFRGINAEKYFTMNSDSFLQETFRIKNKLENSLHNIAKDHKQSDFYNFELKRIKYKSYSLLNRYHEFYFNSRGEYPKIHESYYSYHQDANFNDSLLIQLPEYMQFILSFVDANTNLKRKSENGVQKLISEISEINGCKHVLDEMLFHFMYNEIYRLRVSESEMNLFNDLCNNPEYISQINSRYEKYKKIMSGMPAPDFRLMDKGSNIYTLVDFKGKYLYMDIWGLYCSPCLRAMPEFNRIKQQFKDKAISFIGVCRELPENKERWIQRMEQFNVTGSQFLPENEDKFIADYLIGEIPRYILIDPEGNFINANAPKPSEELRRYLNQLIK